jgi:DNA-binding response OmpR family regulator
MGASPGPLTVLVLDDEATVRDSLRRFLKIYGYDSVEAESVEQATAALSRRRIDAVILDVRLPGARTGLDVLDALRERSPRDIPVLVLTGRSLTEAEERRITSRRGHLFHKPEGLDTLVKFLDQLTGRDQTD